MANMSPHLDRRRLMPQTGRDCCSDSHRAPGHAGLSPRPPDTLPSALLHGARLFISGTFSCESISTQGPSLFLLMTPTSEGKGTGQDQEWEWALWDLPAGGRNKWSQNHTEPPRRAAAASKHHLWSLARKTEEPRGASQTPPTCPSLCLTPSKASAVPSRSESPGQEAGVETGRVVVAGLRACAG